MKGLKIERLLKLTPGPEPVRLLEVGTGSGGIAHYFASHPRLDCEVTAVDVRDQRLVTEGYRFEIVAGTLLPFDDASFDIVLSNHVIEHVGERQSQLHHLRELKRVLSRTGSGYLAVPNRWMLVEPHYRLAFLSWLPRSLRSPYLRLRGRGSHYDCEPLTLSELDALLAAAGFRWEHLEVEALRETLAIEHPPGVLAKALAHMPNRLLAGLRGAIPTLICRVGHRER